MDYRIITALIASSTSIISLILFKPILDRHYFKFQLKQSYRAEQSKKAKDHIALYKGTLIEVCESLNQRLKNFAKNCSETWITANGDYKTERYYLDSTVHRFLALFGQIKIIQKDLIYIDTTIVHKKDLRMLKYLKLLHAIMTDVDLFENKPYDKNNDIDHFFSSSLYNLSNSIIIDKQVIDFDKFLETKSINLAKIQKAYEYFDSINPIEDRLRCERLKILHLALISFLNEYGYDYQKTDDRKLKFLKTKYGDYKLLENYKKMVKKFKLSKTFCDPIKKVIDSVS